MITLLVMGPAGSGKTSFSHSFGKWLEGENYSVCYVNLDPGAELLPFIPSFDVREIVTTRAMMERGGLGPNGALIKAAEIIEENIGQILRKIKSFKADYVIVDTPGQMEIFLFRKLGSIFCDGIEGRKACVFIMDPSSLPKKSDVIALKLLNLVIELRLGVPSLELINKIDLFGNRERAAFLEPLKYRQPEEGLRGELASSILETVSKLEKKKRAVLISAITGEGFRVVLSSLGELFCSCGDLT